MMHKSNDDSSRPIGMPVRKVRHLQRRSGPLPCGRVSVGTALTAAWCLVLGTASPATEGEPRYVVVKAGRVITVSGEEYAPGTVVIEDGKITAVGRDLEYPSAARVIRAPRETVLPGFVHPQSRWGLESYRRSGVHGHRSAADDVFAGELSLEDLLSAGYTTVCFIPDGSDIPGRAAAYRTAGPEESQRYSEATYLQVAPEWRVKGKENLRAAFKKAREEIEKVEKARKECEEKQKAAKEQKKEPEAPKDKPEEKEKPRDKSADPGLEAPATIAADASDDPAAIQEPVPPSEDGKEKKDKPEEFKPPEIDPKYQPLVDIIQKKADARMMVRLGSASDWLHFDDVIKPLDDPAFGLALDISRGRWTDFDHVATRLGERKARVVVQPLITMLPWTATRYNLAARLAAAGCTVSLMPLRDTRTEVERMRARVAELVRGGLPRAEAIKGLTLHPAEGIGLGKRIGSLEKEKDADLVFFEGDPLDPHSQVRRVMILGEIVWKAE